MSNILKIAGAGVSAAEETDENFNQTVLLLHGDGSNGAQNNSFLDSSTNNFTITRNGNTTQGTFSPFSAPDGRWSNFFDGSGDYLTTPTSANLVCANNADWTIEFFIYTTSFATFQVPFFSSNGSDLWASSHNFSVYVNTSGYIIFEYSESDASPPSVTGTTALTLNAWNHVALVFDGTGKTLTTYVNGTRDLNASSIATYNPPGGTPRITIGRTDPSVPSPYQYFVNGYVSNVRLTTGAELYSGATITVPTSPLTTTPSSGTVRLLTCQSNRFVDNSSNAFAITVNGNPKVTPFSPFAPTAAYDASVNGGSGYFDGTGDRLDLPVSQTPLLLGSSDFTFECWVYRQSSNTQQVIFGGQTDLSTVAGSGYGFQIGSAGTTDLYSGASTVYRVTSPDPSLNAWSHLAYVRTGGTFSTYLNGTRVGTRSDLSTNAINNGSTTYPPVIGLSAGSTIPFLGYIASARLIKGSGGYDATGSTITIPTAPLTAITNTSLLLNFTNAGIFDNTGKNVLETVGNAQIDTTTKKYGTGALEFDGSDQIVVRNDPNFQFGSGNFTIEFFVYFNSVAQGNTPIAFWSTNQLSWSFYIFPAGTLTYYLSSNGTSWNIANGTSIGSVSTGTWYHVALVRNGTTITPYLDGVAGTATNSVTSALHPSTSNLWIGSGFGSDNLNGFIDDLRITKGVARYTTAFTPPDKAFADL